MTRKNLNKQKNIASKTAQLIITKNNENNKMQKEDVAVFSRILTKKHFKFTPTALEDGNILKLPLHHPILTRLALAGLSMDEQKIS